MAAAEAVLLAAAGAFTHADGRLLEYTAAHRRLAAWSPATARPRTRSAMRFPRPWIASIRNLLSEAPQGPQPICRRL